MLHYFLLTEKIDAFHSNLEFCTVFQDCFSIITCAALQHSDVHH
jgi:hypothetical protein